MGQGAREKIGFEVSLLGFAILVYQVYFICASNKI